MHGSFWQFFLIFFLLVISKYTQTFFLRYENINYHMQANTPLFIIYIPWYSNTLHEYIYISKRRIFWKKLSICKISAWLQQHMWKTSIDDNVIGEGLVGLLLLSFNIYPKLHFMSPHICCASMKGLTECPGIKPTFFITYMISLTNLNMFCGLILAYVKFHLLSFMKL